MDNRVKIVIFFTKTRYSLFLCELKEVMVIGIHLGSLCRVQFCAVFAEIPELFNVDSLDISQHLHQVINLT